MQSEPHAQEVCYEIIHLGGHKMVLAAVRCHAQDEQLLQVYFLLVRIPMLRAAAAGLLLIRTYAYAQSSCFFGLYRVATLHRAAQHGALLLALLCTSTSTYSRRRILPPRSSASPRCTHVTTPT